MTIMACVELGMLTYLLHLWIHIVQKLNIYSIASGASIVRIWASGTCTNSTGIPDNWYLKCGGLKHVCVENYDFFFCWTSYVVQSDLSIFLQSGAGVLVSSCLSDSSSTEF